MILALHSSTDRDYPHFRDKSPIRKNDNLNFFPGTFFFLRCDSLFNPIASGLADECLPLLTTYSDRQGFADLFFSLRLTYLLFILDKVLLL